MKYPSALFSLLSFTNDFNCDKSSEGINFVLCGMHIFVTFVEGARDWKAEEKNAWTLLC